MNIKCPKCGNQGSTHIGSDAFDDRGTWEGKPVRKCLRCGAGMTVGFPKRIKLIEPGLWSQMEASWSREFGTGWATDADEEPSEDLDDDGDDYPRITCPYCGNTGSSAPGSAAFEYRVALGDPGARMCRRCGRGFWLYAQTGDTEPMGDEAWAGIEAMHATLGGGANVDAEWARRRTSSLGDDDEPEDGDDEADEALDHPSEAPVVMHASAREAVRLRGRVQEIEAEILEIRDPAPVGEDDVEPDDGMRYVAVRLKLNNTGNDSYIGMPSLESRLITADGVEHEATIGWLKPDLDELDELQAGQTADGFITFEIPEGARVKAFRFVFDEKTPPDAAEWAL